MQGAEARLEAYEQDVADRAEHEDAVHDERTANDAEFVAFRCPDCNARYVAREASAAATCPWCGSDLQPAG